MAIISIRDLRVVRGGAEILRGLSWIVEPEENWVILGANGSGKTTLLSCVTGYVTPSSGTIQVLGNEYGHSDWRELRKQVGLVSSSIRHWCSVARYLRKIFQDSYDGSFAQGYT